MNDKKTPSTDENQAQPASYRKPNQRRKALKTMVAGGGAATTAAMLPEKWAKPIVDSIALPAHARTSFFFNTCQVTNWQAFDTNNTPANQGPFNEGATTIAIGNSTTDNFVVSGLTATTITGGAAVHLRIDSSGGTPITEGNDFDAVSDPTNGVATFPNITVEGSNTALSQADFFTFTYSTVSNDRCVVRIDVGPGT